MNSPQVNTPAIQELFAGVQQLNTSELKDFSEQVALLYAQRKTPHLSRKETDLLTKINEGIPESDYRRFLNLHQRRDTLENDERKEYLRLIGLIENKDAERVGYLAQLADLRSVSIETLMNDLGIIRPNYA